MTTRERFRMKRRIRKEEKYFFDTYGIRAKFKSIKTLHEGTVGSALQFLNTPSI